MVKKCFIEVPKGGEEQAISAYINMPDLYAPYLTVKILIMHSSFLEQIVFHAQNQIW